MQLSTDSSIVCWSVFVSEWHCSC